MVPAIEILNSVEDNADDALSSDQGYRVLDSFARSLVRFRDQQDAVHVSPQREAIGQWDDGRRID